MYTSVHLRPKKFISLRIPSPRNEPRNFHVASDLFRTKKFRKGEVDWLAGLVSEIPKRTSDNDVRLVNLTAKANL